MSPIDIRSTRDRSILLRKVCTPLHAGERALEHWRVRHGAAAETHFHSEIYDLPSSGPSSEPRTNRTGQRPAGKWAGHVLCEGRVS